MESIRYHHARVLEYLEREEKILNERKYEAPKIIKKEKMTFPIDILNNLGIGQVCKQCSSCHNCR
ncbi:MAG: hypothetical protein KJ646_01265 [Nanoarchaeota archaeon]|nr:hypothetical protein [Nanoarchaeota archaeon]